MSHLRPSRSDWSEFFTQLAPYAFTTIQFNNTLNTDNKGYAGRGRAIDRSSWVAGKLLEEIDTNFFEPYLNAGDDPAVKLKRKVSRDDRFNGFAIIEKAGVSTHLHILWYQPRFEVDARDALARTFAPEIFSRKAKQEFLLRALNSREPKRQIDRSLLATCRFREMSAALPRFNARINSWSVQTTIVYDASGVSSYVSKEADWVSEFGDQVFDLRERQPSEHRLAPSRCWTIDSGDKDRIILDRTQEIRMR